LIYLRARWYDAYLNQFIQPDTIVPDARSPEDLNRYVFARDNPLKYTDPSGHCPQGDSACWEMAKELSQKYWWDIDTSIIWPIQRLQTMSAAAQDIQNWFEGNGGNGLDRMLGTIGRVFFTQDWFSRNSYTNHVSGSTVYLAPEPSKWNVVHEIGHVIDNVSGSKALSTLMGGAAIWGGGASDAMAQAVGGETTSCPIRAYCPGYKTKESFYTTYSRTGPSEDFAETFAGAVEDPQNLATQDPIRAKWMKTFAELQVNTPCKAPIWMQYEPPRPHVFVPGQ
jgi:hypothetical protein